MPEYLSPGVYVEEVPAGPVPIEGVSTSTTGAVGQTERGPLGAQLVTSWTDYERQYGGLIPTERSYLPWAVKAFFDNGGSRLFVSRVVAGGAQTASENLGGVVTTAVGPGAWATGIYVSIRDGTQTGFRMTLVYWNPARGYRPASPLTVDPLDPAAVLALPVEERPPRPDVVEDFDNLVLDPLAPNHFSGTVNGASRLVRLSGDPAARPANQGYTALGDFDDATDPLDPAAYLGAGAAIGADGTLQPATGLEALAAIDDISLLIVPDRFNAGALNDGGGVVTGELVVQCETLKDRFAILSTNQNLTDVDAVVNAAGAIASSYAAVYYPWLHVVDPRTGGPVKVPPDGAVAGIYARTDEDRGVHKAPANEEVLGLLLNDLPTGEKPLEIMVDKGRQDILNPNAVDCFRDFRSSGRGVRVWGARTRSGDPQWRYVNVRRLFIFLEKSIDRGTQWVVFEGNYESTWARVTRSVSDFLTSVWRDGGLAGATPAQAFFVRCDRTTMTPDDIANGRLICLIGVAPVFPAEFVIFRLSQLTIEAQS